MLKQLTTFDVMYILDRMAEGMTTTGDAVQIARLLWRESVSHIAQYAAGTWLQRNGEPDHENRPWTVCLMHPLASRNMRSAGTASRDHGNHRRHSDRLRNRRLARTRRLVDDAPTDAPGTANAAASATVPGIAAPGNRRRPVGALLTPATILERATANALLPYDPAGDTPAERRDL